MRALSCQLLASALLVTAPAPGLAQSAVVPSGPTAFRAVALRPRDPAPSGWTWGITERLRFDDKAGAGPTDAGASGDFSRRPGDDNRNRYLLSRLLTRLGYADPRLSVLLEGRTSTSWGDERFNPAAPGVGLSENDAGIDLHQAYLMLGGASSPLTLKVGRQELAYGDQRLIGAARWNNLGRSFDAAKVRWQGAAGSVELFSGGVVYPDSGNLNRSRPQDRFSGLYASLTSLRKRELIEAYALARNVRREIAVTDWSGVPSPYRLPGAQDIYTIGTRLRSKPGAAGAWDYGVELAGQFGNRAAVAPSTPVAAALAAPRLSHRAGALIARAGHTWAQAWGRPRLGVTYSHGSGDRDATDGRSGTFQHLFPTGHMIYGTTGLSSLQNLRDLRLTWEVQPAASLALSLEAHQQFLARSSDYWYTGGGAPRNFTGAAAGSGGGFRLNPAYSRELGRELALIATWTANRWLQLEAGAAHYFRGDYIRRSLALVGSKDASCAHLQVTLTR